MACVSPEVSESTLKGLAPRSPRQPRVRSAKTAQVISFDDERQRRLGEREIAASLGTPRGTLRSRSDRLVAIDAPAAHKAFFNTPEGVLFLQRLLVVLHLVLCFVAPCGVAKVCLVVRLSGLDKFVCNSYGAQQRFHDQMRSLLVQFGVEERARLSPQMALRWVSVALDETFLRGLPCLVALDLASNFMFVEKLAEERTEEEWTNALHEGFAGLKVEVLQGVGDKADALTNCIEENFGAPKIDEVFHGQQSLSKATGGTLRARVSQAEEQVRSAEKEHVRLQEQRQELTEQGYQVSEGLATSDQRLAAAARGLAEARDGLQEVQGWQDEAHACVREVGDAMLAYDPDSGEARTAEQVEQKLNDVHERLDAIAEVANLPEKHRQELQNALKDVPLWSAVIQFYQTTIGAWLAAQFPAGPMRELLQTVLIPYFYLQLVAKRTKKKASQKRLRATVAMLQGKLETSELWKVLTDAQRSGLQQVALQCAEAFQRSSSAVEGRNGWLKLMWHALRRISQAQLSALTVIHNYLVCRADGTTAAERFFGQKPRDLVEYLFERMPEAALPRARRSRPRANDLKFVA
jgi:hypothetical protein